jgi:hypothetical protein
MKVICQDRLRQLGPTRVNGRSISGVSAEVDRLLGPKTLEQLSTLEKQVKAKLESDEPIDVEYWEQLLKSISVYRAKAESRNIYESVIDARFRALRQQQIGEAESLQGRMASSSTCEGEHPAAVHYSRTLDPEPQLKINGEDKGVELVAEADFLAGIVSPVALDSVKPFLTPMIQCRHQSAAEYRKWVIFPPVSRDSGLSLRRPSRSLPGLVLNQTPT